jgi:hypothetical protein
MEPAMVRPILPIHIIAQLQEMAEKPTLREWLERLQRRTPVDLGFSSAEAIRELRGPLRVGDSREE